MESNTSSNLIYSYYEVTHPTNEALAHDCSMGIFIEKELVVAGHLWKAEWKPRWETFWGADSNHASDPRNGILWNRAIESAFASGRITIYEDQGTLKWYVWDPTLRSIKLAADLMGTPENKSPATARFSDTTFGDLEAQPLYFRNEKRPFCHCLCLHAKVTKLAAFERGWQGQKTTTLIRIIQGHISM